MPSNARTHACPRCKRPTCNANASCMKTNATHMRLPPAVRQDILGEPFLGHARTQCTFTNNAGCKTWRWSAPSWPTKERAGAMLACVIFPGTPLATERACGGAQQCRAMSLPDALCALADHRQCIRVGFGSHATRTIQGMAWLDCTRPWPDPNKSARAWPAWSRPQSRATQRPKVFTVHVVVAQRTTLSPFAPPRKLASLAG